MLEFFLFWIGCAPAAAPPPVLEVHVSEPRLRLAEGESPEWTRAMHVAAQRFLPVAARFEAPEVTLAPVQDPTGARIPYLIDASYGPNRGRVLVVDDAIVERGGGVPAASTFLHTLGFPAHPLSRELLIEILGYFGVVDSEWVPTPLYDWSDLDATFTERGDPPPTLTYHDGGATLRLSRAEPTGDGDTIQTRTLRVLALGGVLRVEE